MDIIPKIKKTITSFLTSEEGKISKQSLLVLGTLVGTASITSVYAQCPPVGGGGGCTGGGCSGGPGPSGSGPSGCGACGACGAAGSCGTGPGGSTGCSGQTGTVGCAVGCGTVGCGSSGGGGNGCFTHNQLVLTPQGAKEISKIEVDSKVISYDEKADTFIASMVGRVIIHDGKTSFLNNFHKYPLVKLSIKINDKMHVTKATDNHRYFDAISKVYRQLRDFRIGDKIKTIEGDGIIVEKSNIIDENSPIKEHNEIVYNLCMRDGPESYIVNGAVVHNGGK